MFWYWFGFIAFLVLIFSGFFGLKMFNINLPKSLCVRYFIFSAFIDAFYISIVYNHLLCQFIFGGLCLLTIFMNLSISFVNSDKSQPIKRFDLLFDFLCGIGLTIYLLYIIPNESLQSIMIPVVSAVYGGLLTLIGVAWTIKNAYKEKKEDEIKKAKPIVFICDFMTSCDNENKKPLFRILTSKNERGTLKKTDDKDKGYQIREMFIRNSDYSYVSVIGFRINNDYHLYDIGQVLPKNEVVDLYNDFMFEIKDEIKYVAILIQDMLENIYELEVKTKITKLNDFIGIDIVSGIELKKTDLPINPKEI